jgi:hypothetical protein
MKSLLGTFIGHQDKSYNEKSAVKISRWTILLGRTKKLRKLPKKGQKSAKVALPEQVQNGAVAAGGNC